jgi:tRNA A37 methylthiotransferase MiaB
MIEVSGERVCETSFDQDGKYLKEVLLEKPLEKVKSYVTIMQGCDHYCSFCIVPYVRGRITSKPIEQAVAEAKQLVADGAREIVLTGINLGEYGKDQGPCLAGSVIIHNFGNGL